MPHISTIFPDPYDPDKSFWVHQGLGTLRTMYVETDEALREKNYKSAKPLLTSIANNLPKQIRQSFYKRAVYNSMYLQPWQHVILKFKIDPDYKNQFKPDKKDEQRFENVKLPAKLQSLVRLGTVVSKSLYGWDFLKTNVSVRYASELAKAPMSCDDIYDVNERLLSVMHVDQKKGMTTIVYLSDVTETNGCFSYLEGSHLIPQSPTIRAMHEAFQFDMGINRKDKAYAAGIPLNLFGTTQAWENLPKHKRDLARPYLVKHIGPVGTSISFAGNCLVHSGGYPLEGDRYAMFIAHTGMLFQRAKPLLVYRRYFT